MGYKIDCVQIKNIEAPITCIYGDKQREFMNGFFLAETVWNNAYQVKRILACDGKIEIVLETVEKGKNFFAEYSDNWVEKEIASRSPQYNRQENWVREYKKQFGVDPSFF